MNNPTYYIKAHIKYCKRAIETILNVKETEVSFKIIVVVENYYFLALDLLRIFNYVELKEIPKNIGISVLNHLNEVNRIFFVGKIEDYSGKVIDIEDLEKSKDKEDIFTLALFYDKGVIVPQNKAKAEALYLKVCSEIPRAYYYLANFAENPHNFYEIAKSAGFSKAILFFAFEHVKKGEYLEAEKHFLGVLTTQINAYFYLASIYKKQGKMDLYEKYLRIGANMGCEFCIECVMKNQQMSYSETQLYFRKARRLLLPKILSVYAFCLFAPQEHLCDLKKSKFYLKLAIKMKNFDCLIMLARAYFVERKYNKMIRTCKRSISLGFQVENCETLLKQVI